MKKYFILAAAAIAMAACSNDDESVNIAQNDNVISLSASVAGPATRAAYNVQSTCFDAGQVINVECTPTGGTLASYTYTTVAASGNVNALSPTSGTHYWPANGSTVTVKAYYPSTVASSTTSFSVQDNQSTDASYMQSDLMYSTTMTEPAAKAGGTIGLTFNHALTKIIVKLTPGAGMDATAIANCTVTLHAKKAATISSGEVTAATDAAAGDIIVGTGSDATNGIAAIIVPQTIDGSSTPQDFITITSGGNSATYKLSAETTFAAGTVYTYSLAVGMNGVTLQSTSITNWADGGTVTATGSPLTI